MSADCFILWFLPNHKTTDGLRIHDSFKQMYLFFLPFSCIDDTIMFLIQKTEVINDNINEVTISFSIRTARRVINKTISITPVVGFFK